MTAHAKSFLKKRSDWRKGLPVTNEDHEICLYGMIIEGNFAARQAKSVTKTHTFYFCVEIHTQGRRRCGLRTQMAQSEAASGLQKN